MDVSSTMSDFRIRGTKRKLHKFLVWFLLFEKSAIMQFGTVTGVKAIFEEQIILGRFLVQLDNCAVENVAYL